MTYQWKLPGVIPVNAQTAGEELERIYQQKGRLDPADIVDESRSPSAPLHPCFEWNDAEAAEKYRRTQAQCIVRSITTVCDTQKGPQEVRAFVRIQSDYKPIRVAINCEENLEELRRAAFNELAAFRRKYQTITDLLPVFDAIDALNAGVVA